MGSANRDPAGSLKRLASGNRRAGKNAEALDDASCRPSPRLAQPTLRARIVPHVPNEAIPRACPRDPLHVLARLPPQRRRHRPRRARPARLLALFADVIAPYDPAEQYRDADPRPPSLAPVGGHVLLLGTDPVGRDILIAPDPRHPTLARDRPGLGRPVAAGGVLHPGLAGFYRGRFAEYAVMRLMDVMLALPSLLLRRRRGRGARAGSGQRDVRDRQSAAALRAPDPRRGASASWPRTTCGVAPAPAPARLRLMFDTVPNRAAPLIVRRDARLLVGDPRRRRARLPGLGASRRRPSGASMLASALEFIQSAWWVVTLPA